MRHLIVPITLAALCGCATPTTGQKVLIAGPEPTRAQAEAEIRRILTAALKDPDSLKQFEMDANPRQITWYRGLLNGGGNESAWLWCFQYNAKNSYGAYTGVKRDGLAMRVTGDGASSVPVNVLVADATC